MTSFHLNDAIDIYALLIMCIKSTGEVVYIEGTDRDLVDVLADVRIRSKYADDGDVYNIWSVQENALKCVINGGEIAPGFREAQDE